MKKNENVTGFGTVYHWISDKYSYQLAQEFEKYFWSPEGDSRWLERNMKDGYSVSHELSDAIDAYLLEEGVSDCILTMED